MAIEVASTDRVTVAGLPGSGKTVLSMYLASQCMPNLLIYDPLDQYSSFPSEVKHIPPTDSAEEFEAVCRTLCYQSNKMFVVEEAERVIGQGTPMGPHAFDVINRGRNWGIGMIAVTRRIQRLSKDYFDLCRHVFLFRCGLKSYDYLEDMIGKPATQKLRALPQYHFLHYNLETEEVRTGVLRIEGEVVGVQRIDETAPVQQAQEIEEQSSQPDA